MYLIWKLMKNTNQRLTKMNLRFVQKSCLMAVLSEMMVQTSMMVSYLPDQSCVCKWRPDLSIHVELLILHNIWDTGEGCCLLHFTYQSNPVFGFSMYANVIFTQERKKGLCNSLSLYRLEPSEQIKNNSNKVLQNIIHFFFFDVSTVVQIWHVIIFSLSLKI